MRSDDVGLLLAQRARDLAPARDETRDDARIASREERDARRRAFRRAAIARHEPAESRAALAEAAPEPRVDAVQPARLLAEPAHSYRDDRRLPRHRRQSLTSTKHELSPR